jgi:5-oxoprolinase (ATP-hydrolysing) subunit A
MYINCDMAESYGHFTIGDDHNVIPLVDACNIACGFHGGDSLTIRNTIKLAVSAKKLIGAHPSYPDLAGFGRNMHLSKDDLYASMMYQIGAVKSITEALGGKLHHVKPHGALYNYSVVDTMTAVTIAQVIYDIDPNLIVITQLGSQLAIAASELGHQVHGEVFADRRYDASGRLASREVENAIIHNPEDVFEHYKHLKNGHALTVYGNLIPMHGHTVCLHGDHPEALRSLQLIKSYGS